MRAKEARDVLGVRKGATKEELGRAYRRAARRWHPDSSADPSVEILDSLKEAVRVLGRGVGIRAQLARGKEELARAVAEEEHLDVVSLRLTAAERAAGGTYQLEVAHTARCSTCEGTGTTPGEVAPECALCDGQGARSVSENTNVLCTLCLGRGRANTPATMCPVCAGTGETGVVQEYECVVAAGLPVGEIVRVVKTFRGALLIRLADQP